MSEDKIPNYDIFERQYEKVFFYILIIKIGLILGVTGLVWWIISLCGGV